MASNFVQGFEEDDEEQFQSSTILTYSSIDSHHINNNNNPTPDDRSSSHVVSKKKRNLPGNPDPEAEVVALSPRTLMATNRYICEVCHKGFQRDQNLQLHRRGHNLPWKLKQRAHQTASKRVYVCPEPSCVHHDPRRALGDLTGIKKHYCRKHGEKKWKCDKCSKRYAVQSDWKAHAKICGSREYRCDCGTVFSRKDSFVTHRAFCDAISDENYRKNHNTTASSTEPIPPMITNQQARANPFSSRPAGPDADPNPDPHVLTGSSHDQQHHSFKQFMSLNSHGILIPNSTVNLQNNSPYYNSISARTSTTSSSDLGFNGFSHTSSATALLQKAAEMGSKVSDSITPIILRGFAGYNNNNMNNNNNNNADNKALDSVDLHRDGGGGLSASGFSGLAMSDDGGCGNNFDFFMGSDRINNPRTGLYDLRGNSRKGLFVGESEKMTVDFLGMDSNTGNYHSDEWNSCRRG